MLSIYTTTLCSFHVAFCLYHIVDAVQIHTGSGQRKERQWPMGKAEPCSCRVCASTPRPLDGTQVHVRGWPNHYIYIHPRCKYIRPDPKRAGRLFYMEIQTACSGSRKCSWACVVIVSTQTWYSQLLPVSLWNCGTFRSGVLDRSTTSPVMCWTWSKLFKMFGSVSCIKVPAEDEFALFEMT